MQKANKAAFDEPLPILEDEDAETLRSIDRGLKSADEGRVVPLEEVRRRLKAWPTKSSSPKTR